ncbi:MAG: diguanylate cyclase [Myxococcales bacterium]|nr:diguanylate cyclase [Myxococcales bacterium]
MEIPFSALLVQPEEPVLDVIRTSLIESGCRELWTARTVEDAFEVGRQYAAELVVIDVATLPAGTDLRRLSRRLRGAPVVVIAADDQIESAFDAGAVDCIAAPVRGPELVARVRAAIRLRAERTRRSNRERKLSEEIRRLERENCDLERLVCVDSLTGLANRRHALTLLGAEWKRSAREKTPLSVVMIDLDCFHAFNERYGHPGGDACLRRVTDAMVQCLRRPSDFLGRYGGEEFLAVLPNTDAVGARIVAERMCATVEALGIPHETSECSHVVTISAGFASLQATTDRPCDVVIKAADNALLGAKTLGRNGASGEAPAPSPPRQTISPYAWTKFPVVVADPWFVDRIPQFLTDTREEARLIDEARREDDFERVRMIGRRLKANARDFGFDQIRQLAGLVEHAARFEDRGAIREATEELEEYVTHVQVIYRRPLEQAS